MTLRQLSCFNQFPSIALERPLRVFGRSLEVQTANGWTLFPETVLGAAMGLTVFGLADELSPKAGFALKDLKRGIECKNVLRKETLTGIREILFDSTYFQDVPNQPTLEQLISAYPGQSAWQSLRFGMEKMKDTDIYAFVSRMADVDQAAMRFQELKNTCKASDLEIYLRDFFGDSYTYWFDNCVSPQVSVVLNGALQSLAAFEIKGHLAEKKKTQSIEDSFILSLLEPDKSLGAKRPMAGWLIRQQRKVGCSSLQELARHIERNLDPSVSHLKNYGEAVKAWSSQKDLMPLKAAKGIVKALEESIDPLNELAAFSLTRFVAFLCDLCTSGTKGAEPDWKVSQARLSKRYRLLLQAASQA